MLCKTSKIFVADNALRINRSFIVACYVADGSFKRDTVFALAYREVRMEG